MNWNYTFSRREKVLMVVLAAILLIALWYNVIYLPYGARYDEALSQKADVESSIADDETMLANMKSMQSEIDAAKAAGNVKTLPQFDNLANVTAELNTILTSADSYTLSFGDMSIGDDGTVRRPVSIAFTAGSYDSAKKIIEDIDDSKYRCQMDSCTISNASSSSASSVSVTLSITYFEAS